MSPEHVKFEWWRAIKRLIYAALMSGVMLSLMYYNTLLVAVLLPHALHGFMGPILIFMGIQLWVFLRGWGEWAERKEEEDAATEEDWYKGETR
jgi:hypothetical protein